MKRRDGRGLARKHPLMRDFLASMKGKRGCWEYPGSRTGGYGNYTDNKITERAHRAAYRISRRRKVPRGKWVCHSCDNRPCCRPSHLFLGTRKDNIDDCVRKDRHMRGTRHYRAVLTEKAVIEIRLRKIPIYKMAERYGVAQSTISAVLSRKTWRSVHA